MTIRDIAAMAEVSVSTVSKILNHKDNDISEETRKKVLKVIKECQYVPYSKIRETANTRSGILGAVLCGEARENQKLTYYLEQIARKNGYSLLIQFLHTTEEPEETVRELQKAFQILQSKRVEGVFLLPPAKCVMQAVAAAQKEKLPLVVLKYSQNTQVPGVSYGEVHSGFLAAETLIQEGHRNIGCIFYKEDAIGEEIRSGYASALFQNNISMERDKIVTVETAQDAGVIATRVLLNKNVSSIICQDGEIACSVYNTLHAMNVRVPGEISVISATDSQICTLLSPPLHAVEIPYLQIAEYAVGKLLAILEKQNSLKQFADEVLPFLQKRASVSVPPLGKAGVQEKIVVVGSMNMDMLITVPELPKDGQTMLARNVQLAPGGKGANQAVGVGKLGGYVYAIGRLGSDNEGKSIYNNLIQSSVKTDGIVFDTNAISGRAYINVAPSGESSIVVHRGANENLDIRQIRKFKYLFENARFCLLSLEIPEQTAAYTLSLCEKYQVEVMIKPSTVLQIQEDWLSKIAYFIPNEQEINRLYPGDMGIEEKAEYFYQKGVANVIVTLGSKGAYIRSRQYTGYVSSMDVEPLDTTGAADAFISALAVSLSEGCDLPEAIGFASCSAGISITREGVQPALPDRMTINGYQEEMVLLSEIREEK